MNIIHEQLRDARRDQQRAEYRLAVLLAELHAKRLYKERGCSGTVQYAEVELGLEPRHARELLAIGRKLPELPVLAATFAQGGVSWTRCREVCRVATAETDAAWTERAMHSDSRTLEKLVAASNPGDPPPERGQATLGPARVKVTFELEASDAELLWRAFRLQRQAGEHGPETSDGALLAALAGHFLVTPPVEGTPSPERFRVVLDHCPSCRVTHVGQGNGGPGHAVSEAMVEQANCDAEVLDMRQGPGRLAHQIPPAVRRSVLHRDGYRCVVPHCRSRTWLDLHHIVFQVHGRNHDPGNLVVLCGLHHDAIHRGLLRLELEDGAARFFHPDGQPFGPGPMDATEGETRPDLADAVMALLGGRPHTEGELAKSLKLSGGRVRRLLGMLWALGEVTQALTGEWVRTDQLALSGPNRSPPPTAPSAGHPGPAPSSGSLAA